jgi:hypothetical protein
MERNAVGTCDCAPYFVYNICTDGLEEINNGMEIKIILDVSLSPSLLTSAPFAYCYIACLLQYSYIFIRVITTTAPGFSFG